MATAKWTSRLEVSTPGRQDDLGPPWQRRWHFPAAISYSAGAAVSTGDFNGDGILDLLVSNATGTAILQGNGDGTFTQKRASNITADTPLLVADFNGDGKADILTANADSSALTVSLGVTSGAVSLTATGGSNQSAPTGTTFALPLQVTALSNGAPLPGVTINFSAPTSGATATLSSQTAVTNALGVASIIAIAGFSTGSYVVTASYQGSHYHLCVDEYDVLLHHRDRRHAAKHRYRNGFRAAAPGYCERLCRQSRGRRDRDLWGPALRRRHHRFEPRRRGHERPRCRERHRHR